jgi:hypothetical protein
LLVRKILRGPNLRGVAAKMGFRTLNKELAIQLEYETNYSAKCTKIKLLMETSIIEGNMDIVRKARAEAEQMKDLMLIFEEDIEMQKLHIASAINSFIDIAIKHGLPNDPAHAIKIKFYKLIAYCKKANELQGYTSSCVEELINAMNQYSIRKYSIIIKMAIEYIHNNKFKFIYAKDVANAISVIEVTYLKNSRLKWVRR